MPTGNIKLWIRPDESRSFRKNEILSLMKFEYLKNIRMPRLMARLTNRYFFFVLFILASDIFMPTK